MLFVLFNSQALAIEVMVSIKPLHSLTATIMSGVGEPQLIVDGAVSPHHFQLKPSHIRDLNRSDLVIYIDPRFEHFLVNSLKTIPSKVSQLRLTSKLSLPLLERRSHRDWEKRGEGHHHEHNQPKIHGHHHDHNDEFPDFHFWLDPKYAINVAKEITAQLSLLDPDNIAIYKKNYSRLVTALDGLNQDLTAQLDGLQNRHFVVLHDAYQYFESAYKLSSVGTVLLDPALPPSASQMKYIRERMNAAKVVCVFQEPQYSKRVIQTVTENLPVKISQIDPIGAGIPSGEAHYFSLMKSLSKAVADCLKAQ